VAHVGVSAVGELGGRLVHPGDVVAPATGGGVVHPDSVGQRHQQQLAGGAEGSHHRGLVRQGNLGPLPAGDVERDQLTGADAGADVQPVADPGEAPGVVAAVVAGAAVGPRLAGGQVVGVHLGPGVAAEVERVAVGDDVADHRV